MKSTYRRKAMFHWRASQVSPWTSKERTSGFNVCYYQTSRGTQSHIQLLCSYLSTLPLRSTACCNSLVELFAISLWTSLALFQPRRWSSSPVELNMLIQVWFCKMLRPGAAVDIPSLWRNSLRAVPLSEAAECQLAHNASQQAQLLHKNDIIPQHHLAHVVLPQ